MPTDPAKPFDLTSKVDLHWDGARLDKFVKGMVPSMSRTKIQKYIKADRIEVNATPRPANWRVRDGDVTLLRCHEPKEGADVGKRIPLDVIHEDNDILVINKQPGLIVHPVALHRHDTLLNALYWRYKDILPEGQEISLANRLDQNTSGVILVAKHTAAKQALQLQFERRTVKKTYLALCEGLVADEAGRIDLPLGPAAGRSDRCKIGVRRDAAGKPALTHYKTLERFPAAAAGVEEAGYTLVRLEPHTGRQHQLRVHLAEIGHPLVADDRYGEPAALRVISPEGEEAVLSRYALHAAKLTFTHPARQESLTVAAPLAADLEAVVAGLRQGWASRRGS